MDVKIRKVGHSNVVTIPADVLAASGMREGAEVSVTAKNGSIRITKKKDDFTLDDLFSDYDGSYVPEEIDWEQPVGQEVW